MGNGPRRVSVVIPTKNRPRLLQRTLETVLAERGVELDVVVVDDGSDPGVTASAAALGDRTRSVRSKRPVERGGGRTEPWHRRREL